MTSSIFDDPENRAQGLRASGYPDRVAGSEEDRVLLGSVVAGLRSIDPDDPCEVCGDRFDDHDPIGVCLVERCDCDGFVP